MVAFVVANVACCQLLFAMCCCVMRFVCRLLFAVCGVLFVVCLFGCLLRFLVSLFGPC